MKINIQDTTLVRNMSNRTLIETDYSKVDDYNFRKNLIKKNISQENEINTIKEQLENLTKILEKFINK